MSEPHPQEGGELTCDEWLAAVTKNFSQNLLRDRLRLAARERKAAQPGEVWPAKTPLEVLDQS